jgi:hypothetical protein
MATLAYVRTGDFQKLIDNTIALELRLSLTSPTNDSQIASTPTAWTGQVEIHSSTSGVRPANLTVELARRGIEIVPFVRPVSAENFWYAQSSAAIGATGALTGMLNFGDASGRGIGLSFQVVLASVAVGSVTPGDTLANLPPNTAESSVITVTRAK